MLNETRQSIYEKQAIIASLLLYQNVLEQEAWEAYVQLLHSLANYALDGHENSSRRLSYLLAYGKWFRAIASTGYNWREYVISQILASDNPFSQQAQTTEFNRLSVSLVAAAKHDLQVLEEMSLWGGNKLVDFIESLDDRPVVWQLVESEMWKI